MLAISVREAAGRDLIELFVYFAENAGLTVADDFLAGAEASFSTLAQNPLIGAPLHLAHPDLQGLRKWAVRGFENVLIFYLPQGDEVAVMRVLHAARDWWSLLGMPAKPHLAAAPRSSLDAGKVRHRLYGGGCAARQSCKRGNPTRPAGYANAARERPCRAARCRSGEARTAALRFGLKARADLKRIAELLDQWHTWVPKGMPI